MDHFKQELKKYIHYYYNNDRIKQRLIKQVGKRNFSDLLSFPFLSHHRTCRSAYGGSVLYTYCVKLSRFCTHSAKRHFFPIFGIRPIVLGREFLFGHLATKDAEHISSWQRPRTVRSFAMYCTNTATSTSADFLIVTILKGLSRPHGISLISFIVYLPNLRIKVTVAFWNFTVLPLNTPQYQVSVRQTTNSLLFLLSQTSPFETCKSLEGSSATTPRMDFHHRYMTCPSYKGKSPVHYRTLYQ